MEAAVLNESAWGVLEARLTTTQTNLNDFFIVISAILVFGKLNIFRIILTCHFHCNWIILAMQAGFSLMEAGLVRSKNATNILMKSTLDACKCFCGEGSKFG